MTKLKVKNRYGVIPNSILNNPEVSLKAKGLFAYIQSKPDDWSFSIEKISYQMKDRSTSIRKAIQELEKFGLLKRMPVKDEKGQWRGYEYILLENPSSENPRTENPRTDNLYAFSNKDISNKEYSNKDISISNASVAETSLIKKERKDQDIFDIIELFKPINPSYERFFSNNSQRAAAQRLLKIWGKEKLTQIIKFLEKTNKIKYAPTITTISQLEHKMGDLIAFTQKERGEDEKNKILKI